MRIALQPAALNDRAVAQHYRDTIDSRVQFTEHADVLAPEVLTSLEELFPRCTAQFWGATPGTNGANVSKWSKLRQGDAVFFYGQKRLYLAGHIALAFRNQPLAQRLWGRNQDDLTWELMFALTNLREIAVPIEEIRAALGWSGNAFVQGFTVVEGDKVDRLADLVNLDTAAELATSAPLAASLRASSRTLSAPEGPTDGSRTSSWRREHPALKARLVELAGDHCGICGRTLPAAFLVGAHIKKRALCSEEERKDFDNVGMLACLLGCDSLFERGFIAIDHDGAVLISNAVSSVPDVERFVTERLAGRISTWWNKDRERYYAWHREHVFIKTHDGSHGTDAPGDLRT